MPSRQRAGTRPATSEDTRYKFECIPVLGERDPRAAPGEGRLIKACNVPRTGITFNLRYPSSKYNIDEKHVNEWKIGMQQHPERNKGLAGTEAFVSSIATPSESLTKLLEKVLKPSRSGEKSGVFFAHDDKKFYLLFDTA